MKGTTNSQRGTGGGGEKLVISLKTNQTSHEDLIGAKFSVVINGNATEYTWQGASMTIPIPPMLNYSVEFGEVEGYAKPESVTHTAVAGNDRFVTGTYNTEIVTVNVSAEEGSISEYEIQIISDGNVLYTQTTSSATYKIPYGTSYTIKAGDVSGYTTPSEQSFTASQLARNVDVTYSAALKGVFIQDIYGRLYTEDEWDGTQTANGIAVLADECQFVAALSYAKNSNSSSWTGGMSIGELVDGVTYSTQLSDIKMDYDGEAQTDAIIIRKGYNNPAGYCRDFAFPNGCVGYLGAAGEWQAILDNWSSFERIYRNITNSIFNSGKCWTSTGSIYDCAWFVDRVSKNLNYATTARALTYAFTPVISPNDITTFYINITKYSCVKGTTWEQWCKSAFNTDGWYVDSDGSTIRWDRIIDMGIIEYVDGVSATDVISEEQYFRNEKEI